VPAVAGVIAMDETCELTVSNVVPLTAPTAAVMTDEPAATPVASPLELMVATEDVAEVHVAVEVTVPIVPSL
jgi:hypothetical protein